MTHAIDTNQLLDRVSINRKGAPLMRGVPIAPAISFTVYADDISLPLHPDWLATTVRDSDIVIRWNSGSSVDRTAFEKLMSDHHQSLPDDIRTYLTRGAHMRVGNNWHTLPWLLNEGEVPFLYGVYHATKAEVGEPIGQFEIPIRMYCEQNNRLNPRPLASIRDEGRTKLVGLRLKLVEGVYGPNAYLIVVQPHVKPVWKDNIPVGVAVRRPGMMFLIPDTTTAGIDVISKINQAIQDVEKVMEILVGGLAEQAVQDQLEVQELRRHQAMRRSGVVSTLAPNIAAVLGVPVETLQTSGTSIAEESEAPREERLERSAGDENAETETTGSPPV